MIDIRDHGIGVGVGRLIKSIQKGTATLNTGTKTLDVGISNVDMTKAIVRISYTVAAGSPVAQGAVIGKLTESNNLQLSSHSTNTNYQRIVYWTVIEFNNVKSLQSGQYTLSTSSGSVTVSSIDTSKTILFMDFNSPQENGVTWDKLVCAGEISSNTLLKFYRKSTETFYIYWQLIEFD